MHRIVGVALMPAIIFLFATTGFAQAAPETPSTPAGPDKKAETKARPKAQAKTPRFDGQVIAFDPEAGTLRVRAKDKDKEMSFIVESESGKARLKRARVGQAIRVSYQEKEGKFIATALRGGVGGHESAKAPKQRPAAKGMEKQGETK